MRKEAPLHVREIRDPVEGEHPGDGRGVGVEIAHQHAHLTVAHAALSRLYYGLRGLGHLVEPVCGDGQLQPLRFPGIGPCRDREQLAAEMEHRAGTGAPALARLGKLIGAALLAGYVGEPLEHPHRGEEQPVIARDGIVIERDSHPGGVPQKPAEHRVRLLVQGIPAVYEHPRAAKGGFGQAADELVHHVLRVDVPVCAAALEIGEYHADIVELVAQRGALLKAESGFAEGARIEPAALEAGDEVVHLGGESGVNAGLFEHRQILRAGVRAAAEQHHAPLRGEERPLYAEGVERPPGKAAP